MNRLVIVSVILASLPGDWAITQAAELSGESAGELANQFLTPPQAAKAGVWWRWIDGNVTKEGITRDLTEMARQGIMVLDLFDVGGAPKTGPAAMMGSEWRALFQHALAEAARLGVSINVVPAAGWGMGGPWIDATHATKTLAFREIQVEGPQRLTCNLPAASGPGGYYRDAMVVAFPAASTAPVRPLTVRASSEASGYCGEHNFPSAEAVDDDPETAWQVVNNATYPVTLDVTYPRPLPAVGAFIVSLPGAGLATGEIQASDDGRQFRTVATIAMQPGEHRLLSFSPVTASTFRLLVTSAHDPDLRLAEFQMLRAGDKPQLRPGIKWWKFKSGNRSVWQWPRQRANLMLADEYPAPEVSDCRHTDTVDLTGRMSPQGQLTWDVPAGRWTIARFGVVLVGEPPRAKSRAVPNGGYEVDPYSPAAANALYDSTARILVADTPPASRKALTGLFIDSYEIGASAAGQQGTWTEGFRETFQSRHGYDLLPWLPALTRRVVDSRQATNRFLWDYRQLLAELYNGFYAQWTKRAHADGLLMRAENVYGTYPMPHIDGLAAGGRVDVPMGEFWYGDALSYCYTTADFVRTAASSAHIYDKPVVGAESLTIADGLEQSPKDWKKILDENFCKGLNQAMVHLWSQQYDVGARPGLHTYDAINANMTWWPHADGFLTYIARCQHLLRQGKPVADLCYFIPEGSCAYVPSRQQITPAIPDGYEFDGLNAEVLLSRVSCRDGRLTLSHGVSYRYLVLPDNPGWGVTAPVLERIAALVREGITIVGPKPGASPSLSGADDQDRRIRRCADDLWGVDPGIAGVRTVGKGRVIWGSELEDIVARDGLPPDLGLRMDSPTTTQLLRRASWIWHAADGDRDDQLPPGTRTFTTTVPLPAGVAVSGATLAVAADNSFAAQLNGTEIGHSDNWQQIQSLDVTRTLRAGSNDLRIVATNAEQGFAGLIAILQVRLADGRVILRRTDAKNWRSSANGGVESPVRIVGAFGCAPWGAMGCEPTPSIAFAHRAKAGADLYFVSNQSSRPERFDATFRITGRQPEYWDPLTGTRRDAPRFKMNSVGSTVPLELEAGGSIFVVFRRSVATALDSTASVVEPKMQQELRGPWTVQFDPAWLYPLDGLTGEPAKGLLTMQALTDWSQRTEPAYRFYSGIAVYRTQFTSKPVNSGAVQLDLGVVHETARVRLNGKDLGVAWFAPWRINVTGALRVGDNCLEIEVANLWVNRLRGDGLLPPEQRRTSTNHGHYYQHGAQPPALKASGLLGPVRIMTAE